VTAETVCTLKLVFVATVRPTASSMRMLRTRNTFPLPLPFSTPTTAQCARYGCPVTAVVGSSCENVGMLGVTATRNESATRHSFVNVIRV